MPKWWPHHHIHLFIVYRPPSWKQTWGHLLLRKIKSHFIWSDKFPSKIFIHIGKIKNLANLCYENLKHNIASGRIKCLSILEHEQKLFFPWSYQWPWSYKVPWLHIRGDVRRGEGCWGKEVRHGKRKASVVMWELRNVTARTALSARKTSARPPGLPLKPLLWGHRPSPAHRLPFLPWSGLWPPPGSSDASSLGSSLCSWGPWALSPVILALGYSSQPASCSSHPAPRPSAQTAFCFLFSNFIFPSSPTHPRPFHCVFKNSCARVGTFKPYFPPVWALSEI